MLAKDIAAAALKRIDRTELVLYKKLTPALQRAVLVYWNSMRGARKALHLVAPNAPRQIWSKAKVIAEIVKLHRAGHRLASSDMEKIGRHDLLNAAQEYAGGWRRARSLAGIEFRAKRSARPPRWDQSSIVIEIKARQRAGLSLASSKAPKPLTTAARRWFGSWRDAIAAAGLNYEDILLAKTYEDSELLEWLQRLARKKPKLTLNELDENGEHAVVCRRRWGSLEAAARAAGLRAWPVRTRKKPLSREEVLRELRRLGAGPQRITFQSVRAVEGGRTISNGVLHHFLTWDAALRAAGVAKRPTPRTI